MIPPKQTVRSRISLTSIAARLTFSACLAAMLSGCFTVGAVTQPYKRDVSAVKPGEEKADVIAACGKPDSIAFGNGKEIDFYLSNPDGPSGPGGKVLRVTAGMFVDALTLGLPELFGAEVVATGWAIRKITKKPLPGQDDDSVSESSCSGCTLYSSYYSPAETVEYTGESAQ